MKTKPYVFESQLLATIAYWATSQSPYNAPEGLVEVLECTKEKIRMMRSIPSMSHLFPMPEAVTAERVDLQWLLNYSLGACPQFAAWNRSKKGNHTIQFVSAFSRPDRDYDFIDLDALMHNILRSCAAIDALSREYYSRSPWSWRRWIWSRSERKLKIAVDALPHTE